MARSHVVIAQNLAGEPDARQFTGGQAFLFRHSHLRWFAVDELDPARGAAGIASARVKDVHIRILLDREYQPFI